MDSAKGIVLRSLGVCCSGFFLIGINEIMRGGIFFGDIFAICLFTTLFVYGMRTLIKIDKRHYRTQIISELSQMHAIMNNTPFLILLRDINGQVIVANEFCRELFGLSSKNLIGKNIFELINNPEIFIKSDFEVIDCKKKVLMECFVGTKYGYQGWCRIIKSPMFDKLGNVEGIVVVLENIESEKDLANKKSTFVATLVHDLKTPTIAQIRAIDVLMKNGLGCFSETQYEILKQIKSSCNYMYDLIFTVIETYLYDCGQTKVFYEEFDLIKLFYEVKYELSNLMEEKGQNFIVVAPELKCYVNADRMQLKRVLVNLVGNAIKYGYKNSEIEINLQDKTDEIIVSVKNCSDYITEDKLADIYEKFKTAANAKFRKTGTGLGLYITKQIIKAHNGQVFALSDKNKTCTFGFSLPKQIIKEKAIVDMCGDI